MWNSAILTAANAQSELFLSRYYFGKATKALLVVGRHFEHDGCARYFHLSAN